MTNNWFISIEDKNGTVLFADFFSSSSAYLPALFRLARYVKERKINCCIKVLTPEIKGVVGGNEFKKDTQCLEFEGKELRDLADAAKSARLNYD